MVTQNNSVKQNKTMWLWDASASRHTGLVSLLRTELLKRPRGNQELQTETGSPSLK
jgi:hypothetical protein